MELNDEQLLRYSRHIILRELGIEGQCRLSNSTVLIVGLGGLGSPLALYLATSGIGKLILADGDQVELSNLQRQIIYTTDDIGMNKTDVATQLLNKMNPEISVQTVGRLSEKLMPDYVNEADVVLDASDNFETRYAVNRVCRQLSTPLISGAVIRMEGQVSVFTQEKGSPCYECLYPVGTNVDESCSQNGILAPVAGIIGSVQATEAIKLIVGFGEILAGKLLLLDAERMEWRQVKLNRNKNCLSCA